MGVVVCRREVVTTDASPTVWGAVWQHRAVQDLWRQRERSKHIKRAGAECCTHGPQALSAPPRGTACASLNRQHLCCSPHQPSGRHQIGAPSKGVQESSGVGLSSYVHPTGDVFNGGAQSGWGLSLSLARPMLRESGPFTAM
ncbi:hypothetical protein ATANTOWER_003327 [Ataeniobius toweri]|uniref:Uncharacterized protein n=1 Tax=Ataeniobius toweri TaxID=208326 RepID=A0ABU7ACY3_9TELE|nr:hypothetical protein [Ataeniobius toweri]